MPIYEYQCARCKTLFEEFRSIHDSTLPPCPSCAKRKVERLISSTSFQLRGTGWYATDYKSSKAASKASEAEGNGPSEPKAATS